MSRILPLGLALVAFAVNGLPPGSGAEGLLHAGPCEAPNTSFGRLGAPQADGAERASLLTGGDHSLIVMVPGTGVAAGGRIPQVRVAPSIARTDVASVAGLRGVPSLFVPPGGPGMD